MDREKAVVNFSYLRSVYVDEDNEEEVNDCAQEAGSYEGAFGEELSERDQNLYGECLMRDCTNVWLRNPVLTLNASMLVPAMEGNGKTGFKTSITSTGTLQSDNHGELKRFSLYTEVPDGMTVDLDEEGVEVTGSATDLNGNEVTNFGDYMTATTREVNDKTVVVCDFDFSDSPLDISKLTTAEMTFNVYLAYADYTVYGTHYSTAAYLMPHDEGLDKVGGYSIRADEYDLDEDGRTDNKMAYACGSINVQDNATEWREFVSKYVKSYYSNGYVDDTVARLYDSKDTKENKEKSDYSYRLDFGLGSSNAKNIIFFDNIEQGAKIEETDGDGNSNYKNISSAWQGTFVSIDTSAVKKLGLVPTVYYSEDASQEFDLTASGWTTTQPGQVKSIAIALDTSQMTDGVMKTQQMAYVTVNMQAPADRSTIDKKAVNQYTVQYDAYGLTSGFEKTYTLPSAETYVKCLDNVGKLILQSVDADNIQKTDEDGTVHYTSLTGGKVQIYNPDGTALFENGGKELNVLGRVILNNIRGGEYSWEMVQAPAGYQKLSGKHTFTITDIPETVLIENHRIPGCMTLTQRDADDETHAPLANAKYQLFKADGTQIFLTEENGTYAYSESGTKDSFMTGSDGTVTISNLPWGSYYVQETEAAAGYELNTKHLSFEVGKAQYHADSDTVSTTLEAKDAELPASICLTKTDAVNGDLLKNAYYDVYKKKADGTYEKIYEFLKTNAAGELTVEDLKFGHYRFAESMPAVGYKLSSDPVETDLDETTVGTIVKISQTGSRKTGSVKLQKDSADGMPLAGAQFSLYKKSENSKTTDTLVKENLITGTDGSTDAVSGLTWGDYYFAETKAPTGYRKSETRFEFAVTAENADAVQTVRIVNDRILGSVVLTKLDAATKSKKITGAEFSLYKNDGSFLKSGLITDENGTISVADLEWGSYYFEETKAPAGYGLSASKIRFSVNEENCATVQNLTDYSPVEQVQIMINKTINEQYEPFGNAVFLFEIKGTDINGASHTWNKTIALSSGSQSGSTVLAGIPSGTYTVTEKNVERYKQDSVTAGKNVTVSNGTATANLTSEKEAEVTFSGTMMQYEKFSHSGTTTSIINTAAKLTGFQITYKGPAKIESDTESEYTFTADDLEAVAYYDDGSSKNVSFADLTIDPATVTGSNNASGAGYTVNVSYAENGITVTDAFSVEINLQIPKAPFTVTYDANGGYFGEDTSKTLNQVTYFNKGEGGTVGTGDAEASNSGNTVYDDMGTMMYAEPVNSTKTVTIQGADKLKIRLSYNAPNYNDWVCVYKGTAIVPNENNYDQSVTGKLGNGYGSEDIEVEGDTVQIFFHAETPDSEGDASYYAFVTGIATGGIIITNGKEEDITHPSKAFDGWYTDPDCTDGHEFVLANQPPKDITVYAKWTMATATFSSDLKSQIQYKKSSITAIQRSLVAPTDTDHKITANTSDSEVPIYIWWSDTTLKWWSKASEVYAPADIKGIFANCKKLADISGVKAWNTEKITDMSDVFNYCYALTDISPVASWNMSNVINISNMFYSCTALTDITALENWNVKNVTNMRGTFSACIALTNLHGLENWDVSNVTNISMLFNINRALSDISAIKNWNVENVTIADQIFLNCCSLVNLNGLENWKLNSVTNMDGMFKHCVALKDISAISGWNVSKVTSMKNMFDMDVSNTSISGTSQLTDLTALANWDTSNLVDATGMFQAGSMTTLRGLETWKTNNLTNMSYMFSQSKLTDISVLANWDVSHVTDMSYLFGLNSYQKYGARISDLTPLTNWNVSNVTNMKCIFSTCSNIKDIGPLSNWNVSNVTNFSYMFRGNKFSQITAVTNWNMNKAMTLEGMFYDCQYLTDIIPLTNWDTSHVTNINGFLGYYSIIKSIEPLRTWDVSKVTDMGNLFYCAQNITDLSAIANWNTSSVTSMESTFNCFKVSDLTPLSHWDVSNVKTMRSTFRGIRVKNLSGLENWNTSKVTTLAEAFRGCDQLTDCSAINNWDIGKVTNFRNAFQGAPSHPNFTKRKGTWNSSGTFTPSS